MIPHAHLRTIYSLPFQNAKNVTVIATHVQDRAKISVSLVMKVQHLTHQLIHVPQHLVRMAHFWLERHVIFATSLARHAAHRMYARPVSMVFFHKMTDLVSLVAQISTSTKVDAMVI